MAERFDIESLTLGEMLAVDRASGQDTMKLLANTSGRLLVAAFVLRLRSSGSAPNWNDLLSLRVLDASSSVSASEPDSPGPKSSD